MALIPELEEHIFKGSPEARGVLTKAANKMSGAQQREFLASLQHGDSELQTAVAPYMPKGSTIDPSRVRFKVPPEADVGTEEFSLRGVTTKDVTDPEELNLGEFGYDIELEPNTVTVFNAVNANPRILAHEFRHLEGTDGSPSIRNELLNRIQDLMASQNLKDLKANVRGVVEAISEDISGRRDLIDIGNNADTDDDGDGVADDNDEYPLSWKLQKDLIDMHGATFTASEEEIIEDAKRLMRSPLVVGHMDDLYWKTLLWEGRTHLKSRVPDIRKKGALGHYFKRKVLGNTDATEMPEEYRKGGRVRLI